MSCCNDLVTCYHCGCAYEKGYDGCPSCALKDWLKARLDKLDADLDKVQEHQQRRLRKHPIRPVRQPG